MKLFFKIIVLCLFVSCASKKDQVDDFIEKIDSLHKSIDTLSVSYNVLLSELDKKDLEVYELLKELEDAKFDNVINEKLKYEVRELKKRVEDLKEDVEVHKNKSDSLKTELSKSEKKLFNKLFELNALRNEYDSLKNSLKKDHLNITGVRVEAKKKKGSVYKEIERANLVDIIDVYFEVSPGSFVENGQYRVKANMFSNVNNDVISQEKIINYDGEPKEVFLRFNFDKKLEDGKRNVEIIIDNHDTLNYSFYLK